MFFYSDYIVLYKFVLYYVEDVCNSVWIDFKVRMDVEDFFNGLLNLNGSQICIDISWEVGELCCRLG